MFENGIDNVSNGEEESAVLFEGDFILTSKKNHIYQIAIGNGLSVESSVIFIKFMQSIVKKGNIVSTIHEKEKHFIEGETDASLYFRAKFPSVEFPIDKTTYFIKSNSGSDLMIYS